MKILTRKNKELFSIFYIFFKISGFTIGGGYAMVPAIERNLINKKFISEKEFLKLLSIAQSMPGPIAFNLSVLLGSKLRGFWGALFASIGVLIPPFFGIHNNNIGQTSTEFRDRGGDQNSNNRKIRINIFTGYLV